MSLKEGIGKQDSPTKLLGLEQVKLDPNTIQLMDQCRQLPLDPTGNAQIDTKASRIITCKEGHSESPHRSAEMGLLLIRQVPKVDQHHQLATIITIDTLTRKGLHSQIKKRQSIARQDIVSGVEIGRASCRERVC